MDYIIECLTNLFDIKYAELVSGMLKASGIYIIYCILHYIIPHVYTYFCVPVTIFGFLISPFMSQSPHCIALRWALNAVCDNIKTMFVLIAAWLASKFIM